MGVPGSYSLSKWSGCGSMDGGSESSHDTTDDMVPLMTRYD